MAENMDNLTYYDVLGVPPDSSDEEIRRAYVALAKELHPDRGGSTQSMRLLNRAYRILKDPEQREQYDRSLNHSRYSDTSQSPPQPSAAELIAQEQSLVRAVKVGAGKAMLIGAGLITLGLIITGISYGMASPGGTYVVTWGLVLWGVVAFIRGWYRFLTPYNILHKVIDTAEYKHSFIFEKRGRKPRAVAIIVSSCIGILILFSYISASSTDSNDSFPSTPSGQTDQQPSINAAELNSLKSAYYQCTNEYDSIKSDLDSINQQMDNYSAYGNMYGYNSLVPRQNQLVRDVNDKYAECETKRAAYNNSL